MKNFVKYSLTLAAISVTSLLSANPVNALSLTFQPTGAAFLDSDAIRDLEVAPGSTVSFDVFLDTIGLAVDETLSEVEYTFSWEGAELTPVGAMLNTTLFPGTPNLFAATAGGNSTSNTIFRQTGASIAPNQFNQIATLNFAVSSVLSNDGLADFSLSLDRALDQFGNSFSSLTATQTQELEVQAQAVPTPALLPGLLGMGAAFIRKRRSDSEQPA